MANVEREIAYRCSDDCRMSGCPGHVGKLRYQSTADSYCFQMGARPELHFEAGELQAMIDLLRSLNRVDAIQVGEKE